MAKSYLSQLARRSKDAVLRVWTKSLILNKILNCLPVSLIGWIFDASVRSFNQRGNSFLTYHLRPKNTAELVPRRTINSGVKIGEVKTAIVVQGPILHEEGFTLGTLRWYRSAFPDALIVLSTWEGEEPDALKTANSYGVIVIVSKKPVECGPFNINLQLRSSFEGVLKASELSATHVLKTRTDQRIYARDAIRQLLALQKSFPLGGESNQRERLIAISHTARYLPYHICDFLLFGHTEDMLKYWSAPNLKGASGAMARVINELKDNLNPEIYLCATFLRLTGWQLKWTMSDSLRAYRNRFCIIDIESLDIYWPKHQRFLEHRHRLYKPTSREPFTFLDWLILYADGVLEDPERDAILSETLVHSGVIDSL